MGLSSTRFDRHSLRWRLPLLIALLVSVVLGTFLVVTYREVTRGAVQTASARAQLVATQIAGTLVQTTQQRLAETRRLVSTGAVQNCLLSAAPDACQMARHDLEALPASGTSGTVPGPQVTELWTTAGERLLTIAKPPNAESAMPGIGTPSAAGIGPLQARETLLYSESVVDVDPAPTTVDPPSRPGGAPLGFVVFKRPLAAAPTRDLMNRLAGTGAAIKLGNKAGDVWTDLASAVPAPAVDLTKPGVATYRGADGQRYLGALADIRATPWAIWVEFPEAVVLAPAHAFLQRMVLIAVFFLAAAAVSARVLSARITTPLSALTDLSEAIAGGEYHRRVTATERDEIGRLGTALNIMAERIGHMHRDLETRVAERTASLAGATAQLGQRLHDLDDARAEIDRFFSLSVDMLCIADLKGHFLRINPAWHVVLGWTTEELTSAPYLDFVHPEDRDATVAEGAKLAEGSVTLNFYNRFRCRDGSYRWFSWKAAAHPEQGRIYAAARDVTEQRRAAREVQQHVAELAAVNQELEAFSYSVSHDLRAPLRHVSGFAGMLERSASSRLDEQDRRYLTTITEAAARMGTLIDDLLAFSRTSRTPITKRRVSLEAIVEEVRREVVAAAPDRQIAWKVGTLPDVEADGPLLRVVLSNLLSNAVKYTGTRAQSQIEIGTSRDENGDLIVFVRDNGVGFDMRYVNKLFGVFQRLHSADEFEGTGIGLANVRRIVQRHGGRTWAEGSLDEGATFYFSLPAANVAEAAVASVS